jgi:type II secretory pathway pseudopilin PulG
MNDGLSRVARPAGAAKVGSQRAAEVAGAGRADGFTIVETLIVLAVTGFLFLSAVLLFAGQSRKVEFVQAVQDIQAQLQQTISEVGAGYYGNTGFNCSGVSGNVNLTTGNNAQGSNTGCIFLGKAIQFGVRDTDPQGYYIYSIAGLQDNAGTLASARPVAIARGNATNATANFPDATERKHLNYGLEAVSMQYVHNGQTRPIGAVAFISGLGEYSGGQLMSGTQQVNLVPVGGSANGNSIRTDPAATVDAINRYMSDETLSPKMPSGGVRICFASGGTTQSGLITIGSNGRNLSVKLDIKSTRDCT